MARKIQKYSVTIKVRRPDGRDTTLSKADCAPREQRAVEALLDLLTAG
jgi:hypothetical protein